MRFARLSLQDGKSHSGVFKRSESEDEGLVGLKNEFNGDSGVDNFVAFDVLRVLRCFF